MDTRPEGEKTLLTFGARPVFRCSGVEVAKADIIRASGCSLIDAANRSYFDFEAGVWCAALGHSHPRIVRAMHAQVDTLIHIGLRYTSPVVEAAGTAVLDRLGWPAARCLFLSSGSEAVEVALRMARHIARRPLFLVLSGCFLASYGSAAERHPERWHTVDWAACAGCARECNLDCSVIREIPFDAIAAFVFEPGNSSGLVRLPPKPLVRLLARRVREERGLVLVDEVTTGLGRTGAWFGHQHYDLEPDLVALGKALGNGYPVSAVALRSAVAEALEEADYHHAQSHQDDPLGCSIAMEVLTVLDEERLVDRSARVGASFIERLRALAEQHPRAIEEVRGRGMMIAVELAAGSPIAAESVHRKLLERGFAVGCKPSARLLRFYPPLTMPEEAIAGLIENLDSILGSVARESPSP